MYIDSHCHINSYKYKDNEQMYVDEARQVGVRKFIVVGWDIASSLHAIKIAEKHPGVYAAVGIHPVDAVKFELAEIDKLRPLLNHPKVVALGEIGLDYHWIKDEDERAKQHEFFVKQIALADEFKKPVIIHMRDATQHTFEILNAHTPQHSGVMHSYSGSAEMMDNFLKLNMYIGLGGPVTFLNAKTPKEVAKLVPFSKLLIETDSPYLTPHPHRGKTNGSHFLPLVALEIANLRNVSVNEVAQITTGNAAKLFGI